MNSRELGIAEHFSYRLGCLGSNNFTMVASITGFVNEQKLREALKAVVDSQVMLRAKVSTEGRKRFFQIMEYVPFEVNIQQRKNDISWQTAVEEELKNELHVDSFPLWRFIWIKGENKHEFLMTCNHLLADGRSGVNFYRILLKKLNDPQFRINKNSLFSSYEKQLIKTHGVLVSLKQKLSVFREYRRNKKQEWFQLGACHQQEGSTRIESRTVKSDTLNKLLRNCRENRVTLSTYLSALMSEIFSEKTSKSNSLSLAVDMRPYLKNDLKFDIGYFVTFVDLIKDKGFAGNVWDLAQIYKNRLKSKLNHSQFKFDIFMCSMVLKAGRDNKSFKDLIRKVLNSSMLLTNIGRIEIPVDYKEFKLNRCFHVPSVHLIELPFVCLAVSTLHDEMILNFSYTDAFFSKEKIIKLVDKFMEAL